MIKYEYEIHFTYIINNIKKDIIVAEVQNKEIAEKYCSRGGNNYYYLKKGENKNEL